MVRVDSLRYSLGEGIYMVGEYLYGFTHAHIWVHKFARTPP